MAQNQNNSGVVAALAVVVGGLLNLTYCSKQNSVQTPNYVTPRQTYAPVVPQPPQYQLPDLSRQYDYGLAPNNSPEVECQTGQEYYGGPLKTICTQR